MAKSIYELAGGNLKDLSLGNIYGQGSNKKKRKSLTPTQRIYIWNRPNIYGRTCSICHRRITSIEDLELDHTRAYSKGGTKLALAHRICNRMKSSGSLGHIQRTLGIKTTKRKKTTAKPKKKGRSQSSYGFKIPEFKIPKVALKY